MTNCDLYRLLAIAKGCLTYAEENIIGRVDKIYNTDRLDIEAMNNNLYDTLNAYSHLSDLRELHRRLKEELDKIENKANRYRNELETDDGIENPDY